MQPQEGLVQPRQSTSHSHSTTSPKALFFVSLPAELGMDLLHLLPHARLESYHERLHPIQLQILLPGLLILLPGLRLMQQIQLQKLRQPVAAAAPELLLQSCPAFRSLSAMSLFHAISAALSRCGVPSEKRTAPRLSKWDILFSCTIRFVWV